MKSPVPATHQMHAHANHAFPTRRQTGLPAASPAKSTMKHGIFFLKQISEKGRKFKLLGSLEEVA